MGTTISMIDILELFFAGGGFVTLIIFLIKRHDAKKSEYKKLHNELAAFKEESHREDEELRAELIKVEKDTVRIQLLLLMYHYKPENEHEMMIVAEHYFVNLEANWYMTEKFNSFLEENHIAKPEWFKK